MDKIAVISFLGAAIFVLLGILLKLVFQVVHLKHDNRRLADANEALARQLAASQGDSDLSR